MAIAKVNLKEIATRLDVSIATVSRAMRDHKDISSATKQKVLEIADELGYRPNMLVRGIQTGKTYNIGVMVPPFNSYWTNIQFGIHDYLTSAGYAPLMLWYKGDDVNYGDNGERYVLEQFHKLIDRRVDGFILWPTVSEAYKAHIDELESRELPAVTIDHSMSFGDSVVTDGSEAIASSIRHLYQLGHRKITHIGGNQKWEWARTRAEDYKEAVRCYPDIELSIKQCNYLEEELGVIKGILTDSERPTAICAYSDSLACTIYKVANSLRIKIPQDISIVGFSDNSEFVPLVSPPLTTIRQDGYSTGQMAAKILIDRLQGRIGADETKNIEMSCEFILRESTSIVNADK